MARPRVWPPKIGKNKDRDRVWWEGRWWDLGKSGSPEARAEHGRLLALWAVDPEAVPSRPDEYLVSELLTDWLASSESPSDPRRRVSAGRAASLLLEHHLATPVSEFGPVALQSWQSWLCRQIHLPPLLIAGEKKWNRTYIRDLVAWVRAAFKWGVATERIGYEKYESLMLITPPKFEECREAEPVQAVDPEAVLKTLPFLRRPVRAMVQFQQLTGARPEEVCQMRPADVQRTGRVDVPGVGLVDLDTQGVWLYSPRKWKTRHLGKPRWLVLGPAARDVIEPFLARDPEAYCFTPGDSIADLRREQTAERAARNGGSGGSRKKASTGTFRRTGEKYTPRTYRQAVERAAVRAGVPHWHPYQLRHLFAGEVDFAHGLDAAQAAMGHGNPNTTRRYSKRSFRAAVDVAKKQG